MIHPVTPWTATAQSDIQQADSILEIEHLGYTFNLYNTGDSVWLTTAWPNGARMAFRLAFGMNSDFQHFAVSQIKSGIQVTASTRLGKYKIVVSFPDAAQSLFRYTTTFRADFPVLVPFWPRDIVPLTREGKVENTTGTIHSHQIGGRSGQLFFSMTRPHDGTVFYFQNLSAMSPYCQDSETSLAESVGGQWPEIGFQFPVNKEKPLPAGIEYTISDALVILSEGIPQGDCDLAESFLNNLAAVYQLIEKPEVVYHDWLETSKKALADLYHNKGSWTQTGGNPFLNAYVCDYKTPPEIMVQLAVKLPLAEYLEWSGQGEDHPLYIDLNSGLADFYDAHLKTVVRWHPALKDNLDNSEEQKQDMVMDSWYLHHPLMNLARLGLRGSKSDEKLFLDSLDFVIRVAHHFDYEWPVFYRMTTLEVLKSETAPGNGGEKDVPGSYAHIMLLAWQLTGEKRYLNEAKKALQSLEGMVFDIFYQANNTAFAAAALMELYRETNDKKYLTMSYCCLAGIFKNTQVWDCGYGYGKNFPNFFSVFPLNDAPYTAAYEELEVYAALYQYLLAAEGVEILPSLKILIPEFIKYTTGRLAYYYPPMLPEDMIAEDIKTGEVKKDLWIPLEDIHDGWEKSGEVGQEVYGAGIPFGLVPRQYFRIGDDTTLFIDYPVVNFRSAKKAVTFHIIGDESLSCSLRLIGKSASGFTVERRQSRKYVPVQKTSGNVFTTQAGAMIRIAW